MSDPREARGQSASARSLGHALARWPSTREEFEKEADAAEAKYGPLVMNLRPAQAIGLHRALGKKIDALNAELKADTDRQMRERGPGTDIGSKWFRDQRRGR